MVLQQCISISVPKRNRLLSHQCRRCVRKQLSQQVSMESFAGAALDCKYINRGFMHMNIYIRENMIELHGLFKNRVPNLIWYNYDVKVSFRLHIYTACGMAR